MRRGADYCRTLQGVLWRMTAPCCCRATAKPGSPQTRPQAKQGNDLSQTQTLRVDWPRPSDSGESGGSRRVYPVKIPQPVSIRILYSQVTVLASLLQRPSALRRP